MIHYKIWEHKVGGHPHPPKPLGAPPCLYAICHSHTKRVKRFVDWKKEGFGGKLEG